MLATRNRGKLDELRSLFATLGIRVSDLGDEGIVENSRAEEGIESFATFEANAISKARYYSAMLPGRSVIADDSGLVVGMLGGEPGVRSRRWSGRTDLHGRALDLANNALLVSRLTGIAERSARFVCCAAWCDGVDCYVGSGEVRGRIVDDARGAHGFGYDPHFFVEELSCTLAEATTSEKGRVSHRGRALVALLNVLRLRGVLPADDTPRV